MKTVEHANFVRSVILLFCSKGVLRSEDIPWLFRLIKVRLTVRANLLLIYSCLDVFLFFFTRVVSFQIE